eukprot:scaffold713_cov131-Cylindrotheca_fusiformis.AAC.16
MIQRSTRRLPILVAVAWIVSLSSSSRMVVDASTSAGGAALSALRDIDLRYFVAGGTCAAFSHGVTTPIDVVKTRIQADPERYNKGLIAATKSIIQTEGPSALLGGLGPTVVGYGVEGAMKFGVYEVSKPILKSMLSTASKNRDALAFMVASVFAGAIAALLLCPMESLRIKQVTDPSFAEDSIVTGIPKIVAQDGIISLFGGVLAMLSKQVRCTRKTTSTAAISVPYTFGKQVSFDMLAAFFYQFFAKFMEVVNKWFVSVAAAACASLVACILSQPGDMILTETYRAETVAPFSKAVQEIWSRGKLMEFFRGLQARILHVGMIITSQLVVYDIVKQMLGLPATGSH